MRKKSTNKTVNNFKELSVLLKKYFCEHPEQKYFERYNYVKLILFIIEKNVLIYIKDKAFIEYYMPKLINKENKVFYC